MNYLGVFESVLLVAALNLEVAILSINLGAKIKRTTALLILAVSFALFHCLFSCSGFLIGSALSNLAGTFSRYIGGAILVGVGLEMVRKSFATPCSSLTQANIFLVLFGAGIEDFAGGISAGAFAGSISLLILLFILVSVPINLLAFWLGRTVMRQLDLPIDFVTGLLLIAIGTLSASGII